MWLAALTTEIDRNLDTAKATRNLLTEKRDMLQGDVKQRLVLHRFHTDVWDALVNQGRITDYDSAETMVACYQRLKETNELIQKFDEEGNAIIHSPLINRNGNDYGREHVIDIMQELVEQAEGHLRDAYAVADQLMDRTCERCGQLCESPEDREEHIENVHHTE